MTASVAGEQAIRTAVEVAKMRRGPLTAAFRATAASPQVHWSVPRAVGNAVVRNRVRRRLRETLREMVCDGSVTLEDGVYRFGAFTSLEKVSPVELRSMLGELVAGVQQR